MIIVTDVDNGGLWVGAGGADDTSVVRFEAATAALNEDEAAFNAGFYAEKIGTTRAWIVSPDGQRATFDITVAAS